MRVHPDVLALGLGEDGFVQIVGYCGSERWHRSPEKMRRKQTVMPCEGSRMNVTEMARGNEPHACPSEAKARAASARSRSFSSVA